MTKHTPELIDAAPDLLSETLGILKRLCEYWDNGTPIHPGALIVVEAKDILARAEGMVKVAPPGTR